MKHCAVVCYSYRFLRPVLAPFCVLCSLPHLLGCALCLIVALTFITEKPLNLGLCQLRTEEAMIGSPLPSPPV